MNKGVYSLNLVEEEDNFFSRYLIFFIPLFFVLAALLFERLAFFSFPRDQVFLTFIADFIFLNNTHTLFSLAAMFYIVEVRAVVDFKKRELQLITFILATIILFSVALSVKYTKFKMAFELVIIYFGIWHGIWQNYGIISIYSHRYLAEKKSKIIIQVEKILVNSILTVGVVFNQFFISRYETIFDVNITYHRGFHTLTLTLILSLLFAVNLYNYENKRYLALKAFFLSSYALFILCNISILGFIFFKMVHGIQSIFMYKKILSNTQTQSKEKMRFKFSVLLLTLFQLAAFIYSFRQQNTIFFIVITTVSFSLGYIHYYHERFIFKIKNQPI